MTLQTAAAALLLFASPALAAPGNLVHNGDFAAEANGAPAEWSFAGDPAIKQTLTRDAGPDGKGFSAKLECTAFSGGTPSSHAMLCQVGVVSVKRGQWYRLSFLARSEGIPGGSVDVALSQTGPWDNAGLSDHATVRSQWKRCELLFRATLDLAAEKSRLQFWYRSTGTLWLADVALVETDVRPQWHPQLATAGRTNTLPNSSFECGAAGWGSYSPELTQYWYGNVYRLVGDLDNTTAAHGKSSLRITLSDKQPLTYYWDYFDPVRRPVRVMLAAHQGWLKAERGQAYTLSAYLKGDQPGRTGVLFVRQAGGRSLRKDFPLTTEWQRYSFTFTPDQEYFWTAAGVDQGKADAATVWVDAVQLEKGAQATPYQPALPVEVTAEVDAPGGFVAAQKSRPAIPLKVRAFNNTDTRRMASVSITATDFEDAPALRSTRSFAVPAHGSSTMLPAAVPVGREGFFRVQVTPEGAEPLPALRCAVLPPYAAQDSRFGVNHAYPWDWLLAEAHQAGVTWWRDWSIQWRTVQAQAGAPFDFREPDVQVNRVLKQGGSVVGLLPYPSAPWSSGADPAEVAKVEGYNRTMALISHKPKEDAAFGEYAGQCAEHYNGKLKVYQLLNESLYTHYSLPAAAGHTVDDYIRLERAAYAAIKAKQPDAIVLAGPGIWPDSKWAQDFVEAGGLKYCDAFDVHLYPAGDPEPYGDSLGKLWRRMKERGEAKPIWLTELGCYADDDPAITPLGANFGDSAMRRSLHDNERDASEWLVKFATRFFANGGEKIFLHAGTCGEINGQDVGGVFFEYGGAPRKMLAAVAVMARLLPPEVKFEKEEQLGKEVTAYWFAAPAGRIGVAWSTDGAAHSLPAGRPALQVLDLMGNPTGKAEVGGSPVYLVAGR